MREEVGIEWGYREIWVGGCCVFNWRGLFEGIFVGKRESWLSSIEEGVGSRVIRNFWLFSWSYGEDEEFAVVWTLVIRRFVDVMKSFRCGGNVKEELVGNRRMDFEILTWFWSEILGCRWFFWCLDSVEGFSVCYLFMVKIRFFRGGDRLWFF